VQRRRQFLVGSAKANPSTRWIEKIRRKECAVWAGGIVRRGEFVVLQRSGVGIRQSGQIFRRERETCDYRSEPGHQFVAFGLVRKIRLVRPIKNGPEIPLENCTLYRIDDLGFGMSSKELIRQGKRSRVGTSAQKITGFAPKKRIQRVEAMLFPVEVYAHMQLTVKAI
jgi:hypothetical protein